MKVQIIAAVLISLVPGLTFTSQATAAQQCHCSKNETCAGGRCLPNLIVPPENASTIDINKCSVFNDSVTCELPTNRVTVPKKAFENLVPKR